MSLSVSNGCLPTSSTECPCPSSDVLPVLPAVEERTREWVSHLATPSQQPDYHEGSFSGPTADLIGDLLPDEVSDLSSELSHSTHAVKTGANDDASTVSDHNTDTVVTSDCVGDTALTDANTELSETAPQGRTRLGHVIRPVNRLLYTIARQDITKRLQQNVQAVCNSAIKA